MEKMIDGLRMRLTVKGMEINQRFRDGLIGSRRYDFQIGVIRNSHHMLNAIERILT